MDNKSSSPAPETAGPVIADFERLVNSISIQLSITKSDRAYYLCLLGMKQAHEFLIRGSLPGVTANQASDYTSKAVYALWVALDLAVATISGMEPRAEPEPKPEEGLPYGFPAGWRPRPEDPKAPGEPES